MNRIWYYVFRWYAVAIKLIARRGYDKWIVRAHKKAGVIFIGSPVPQTMHSLKYAVVETGADWHRKPFDEGDPVCDGLKLLQNRIGGTQGF